MIGVSAKLKFGDVTSEQKVAKGTTGFVFEVTLKAGPANLLTYINDKRGKAGVAYFTEVEFIL